VAVIGRILPQQQFESKVNMTLEGCEGSGLKTQGSGLKTQGSGLRAGFSRQAAETSTAKLQRTQSLGMSGEGERRGEFIRFFNIRLQISVEICPIQIYGAVASARQAHKQG
jgi:hypothetical protein